MTRWFHGPDCNSAGIHEPGDRHWEIGVSDSEWTGKVWTQVCHRCDRPMAGRSDQGWLCCDRCGTYFRDVPRREVAPC